MKSSFKKAKRAAQHPPWNKEREKERRKAGRERKQKEGRKRRREAGREGGKQGGREVIQGRPGRKVNIQTHFRW